MNSNQKHGATRVRPPNQRTLSRRRRERQKNKSNLGFTILRYIGFHWHAGKSSLQRLIRQPITSLLTLLTIGTVLALPLSMYIFAQNFSQLSHRWQGTTEISLFLNSQVSDAAAKALATRLQERPEIQSAQLIDRNQALESFRSTPGFAEAIDSLGENPLPTVIVVQPHNKYSQAKQVADLANSLRSVPHVQEVLHDFVWLQRLDALLSLTWRLVWLAGLLLGFAAVLVVVNITRMDIENRRDEIEVTKLVGGSNAFICRPFRYTGAYLGLLGALIAALMVSLGVILVNGPIERLAELYHSPFSLTPLHWSEILALMAAGVLIGLLGSRISINRHLRRIEPG